MVIAFKRSAGFGGRGVRSGWNAVRRQVLSNARKIWSNVNSPNLPSPRGGLKFGGKILGGLGGAIAAELLFPPPVSDGTIPAWISDVPQVNEIESPPPPPFTGGQMPAVLYRVTFTYKINNQEDFITNNQNVWGSVRGLFVDEYSPTAKVLRIKAGDGTIADNERNYDMQFASNTPDVFPYYTIDSVVRANGQPDTGGNIETGSGITSAPPPNFPPPLTSPNSASNRRGSSSSASSSPPPATNNSAPNNTNSGEFGKQINGGPGSIISSSPAPTGNPAPGAGSTGGKTTTTKGNVTTKYLQGSGGTAWSINQTSIGSSDSSGTTTTTKYDSNNSNQTIEQRLNAQLDNINNPDTNNTENLTTPIPKSKDKSDFDIDNFKRDLEDTFTTTVIAGVTPTLLNIQSQTTPASQQTNTRAAICDSTNPGGCINSNVLQPLQAGQANNLNLFSSLFANLNDQLVQNPLLKKIDATTTLTTQKLGDKIANGGISSALGRLHKSLAVDRWLNLLNTALLFHNAFMLGSSAIDIIVQVFDNVLDTIGFKFKDVEGDDIEFSQVVSNSIESIAKNIIGEKAFTLISNAAIKGNRIYQSAANVLYSVRGIIDSVQDIQETIGENVSFIGNALKKDGVVRENSYDWMPTNYNNSSRLLNRLEKVRNGADVLEDITSETRDISEEIQELKNNKEELKEAISKARELKTTEEIDLKDYALNIPELAETDEERGTDDD